VTDENRELAERIEQVKRALEEPRDPERELGEQLLGELNRSRTPWYSAGEIGGDDGAAAA